MPVETIPDHALFSPSGAHRWIPCNGSLALEAQIPYNPDGGMFADEGTAAHWLASEVLENPQINADGFIGAEIVVVNGKVNPTRVVFKDDTVRSFTVDEDMAEYVSEYVDAVRREAEGGLLLVEQRVGFSHIVGKDAQFGTADAIIVQRETLQLHDLKYGKGVEVYAEENPQLMLYALGALKEFFLLADFKTVKLFIHQPRRNHMDYWECSVERLQAFGETVRAAALNAQRIMEEGISFDTDLAPGTEQCKFCRGKSLNTNGEVTCPALRRFVSEAVFADFEAVTDEDDIEVVLPAGNDRLALVFSKVALVEAWCKTVRKMAKDAAMSDGLPGYKLVTGRKGHRKWGNAHDVEAFFKKMRLRKEMMYDLKLISPTTAEKRFAKDLPKKWTEIEQLITRKDGAPIVVPLCDKRSPIDPSAMLGDFEDVSDDFE